MSIVTKIYKQNGTPVFVRFGLDLQEVILNIDDWDQELKDIWTAHVAGANAVATGSEPYELSIIHGIECSCCTKIVHESYTRPTLADAKRKGPGRPRTKKVNGFILEGMR